MNNKKTITPFVIQFSVRKNFLDWMEKEFPYFNGKETEEEKNHVLNYKNEIFKAAEQVLHITYEHSSKPIVTYYKQDRPRIRSTYQNGNDDEFINAVRDFLSGIRWE